MTNYENDIMDLLQGDTPKQKYEFLKGFLKILLEERNSGVESSLLTTVDYLHKKGEAMFKSSGNDSYVERCHNHDATMLIYALTNKSRLEKLTFQRWRDEVQRKNSNS